MASARPIRLCSLVAVALFVTTPLGGCAEGLFHPAGPVASAELSILYDSLGIMLAIIVPTIAATLAFAWWYRATHKSAKYLPDFQYSGRIEMVVWSIPAMTILLLGGIGWIGSHDLDPYKPIGGAAKPLRIQVVSLDWKWLFILPDLGIAGVNRVVVPVGTPLSLQLTASGVMNAFLVAQLGSQIAVMPHMETRLHLEADRPGIYTGYSTNFSGDGFAAMAFTIEALAPDKFAQAVAAIRGRGPTLDAASYAELAKPSQAVAPYTYGAVSPGLFDAILRPQTPPAGPTHAERTGAPKEE